MEWIDVNEQLPENNQNVLVLAEGYFSNYTFDLCQKKTHKIFEGYFTRFEGWFTPDCKELRIITHWMMRPKDPIKTEKDEK